jgi:archaemetzincin
MKMMDRIILVLLSKINEHLIEVLKPSLEKTFNRKVETERRIRSLEHTYDARRNQYSSPRLLARLRRIKKNPEDKILGITDVDLYSPGFVFVYGEAEMCSGIATLSLYRLRSRCKGAVTDMGVIEERAIREATHELAHLFYLGHCQAPKCVMRLCTCLADVDRAGRKFCSGCRNELEAKLDPVAVGAK